MDLDKRIELFQKELNFIKNDNIREFVKTALSTVPDYFFEISSSSTNKYHPSYALGDGGLVRHTKVAVRIANELLQLEMMKYPDDEKDCMLAALILHDTYKSGVNHSKYTLAEHPIIAVQQFSQEDKLKDIISENQKNLIFSCIATHMGQWNTDFRSKKEIMEKPKTKYQNFVHLCDYLASRKCIEFNFDV